MAGRCLVVFIVIFGICTLGLSQKMDSEFTMNEELDLSAQVGNIGQLPGLFADITDQEKSSLQYGILDQASSPASHFNISKTGGIISVAKRIDRETLCLMVENCVLKINILASAQIPSHFDSRVITVNFKILDINDNAPLFERSSVVLIVPEGNSLDSVLKITGANDVDYKPEYRVKNYTLDKFHDVFSISTSQTLDGSSEIDLILKQSLDRETKDQYIFTITAYDGGSPPKSSTLSVTVDVTDLNDNAPVFLNSSYSATVDSKASLNKVILRVSATDPDQGSNALITYDFSSLQKPILEDLFRINSSTGEISVIGALRPGLNEFIVEAQDSGTPKLKAQTVVRVTAVNNGNTPPRVSVTTVGANTDQNVVSILEPGGRGLFVAFALVDDDGGDNVVCEIDSNVFKMEPVANKGYKIVLQGSIDRETVPAYNLSVECMDSGDPPLNTTIQFMVKVDDANDNAPEFTQQRYSRTISEGRKNGEFVLQISASDKDVGLNSAVKYSLDSDYAKYFSVDENTGIITAIGDLDRETNPVMIFKVYATDQGKQQQNRGSAEVSLILEDENDNAPKFEKKLFRFQTVEGIEGTRAIGDLTAHDDDEGANGEFEYFFTGSLDGADGAFTVLRNGSIFSSTKLDREERVNYSFSVMVRDKGEPQLMSSASVVVEILDVNDNSPTVLFPRSQNHTILISTVPETGVVLSRVIAYDDDYGDNGSLKFTIVSGNEDRGFEISETTGELRVSQAHRLKNRKHYDVGILISDKGLPPKFNTTSLKIDVFYDNTTQITRGADNKQEDYIIIVAIVAAVTVVFSTLIIVAICVVFHKDKHSSRKHVPKISFHSLGAPDKFCDELKVGSVVQERPATGGSQEPYGMNNLSSPPGGNSKPGNEGTFFQLKVAYPDSQSSSRGKAVSFNLDEADLKSASTRSASSKNDPPPFLTFGSSLRRSSDEDTFQSRSSVTRQVSGVTYAPVSTREHVGTCFN